MDDAQQDGHQRGVQEGGAANVEGPAEVLQQLRFLLFNGHQEGDQCAGTESNCRGAEDEDYMKCSYYISNHQNP